MDWDKLGLGWGNACTAGSHASGSVVDIIYSPSPVERRRGPFTTSITRMAP